MQVSRVNVVVCAVAVATLLGCVDDEAEHSVVSGALDGCVVSVANGGFANTAITTSSRVLVVSFRARASQANMDGVIGIARGDVDAYDNFAASVRFYANGRIEARDGTTYRADIVASYIAGQDYDFQVFIDLATHTYSVYVNGPGLDASGQGHVRLASGFRFRPSQAMVPSVDRVATIVASATGQLDTCEIWARTDPSVLALRDGTWDVVPLADGSAVMSDGVRTVRVNASNVQVRSIAFGGQVAVDAAGNVYVARIANGYLDARSFTSTFASRWTARYRVSGGGGVLDTIVSSTGQLVLLVGTTSADGYTPQTMVRFRSSTGRYLASDALPAGTTAIGLATARYASARTVAQGVELATHSYGDPTGYRSVTISSQPFSVTQMALAGDGSFVIGGHLLGTVDFGDGAMAPVVTDDGIFDAFVAAFTAAFSTRFSDALYTSVDGLATTGREIAVSHFKRTQLPYVNYAVYDPAGNVLRGAEEAAFAGFFGRPGPIALARSGRVYLDTFYSLAGPNDTRWPFLVTLAP